MMTSVRFICSAESEIFRRLFLPYAVAPSRVVCMYGRLRKIDVTLNTVLCQYLHSVSAGLSYNAWVHSPYLMLRSNHLVQTVRTTFPAVQTVPFTFPLGISHLHLWRSGDGFSDSVCTAGKKMASLHIKPYIIALQLQLCTGHEPSYSRITHALVRGGGGC